MRQAHSTDRGWVWLSSLTLLVEKKKRKGKKKKKEPKKKNKVKEKKKRLPKVTNPYGVS